MNGFNPRTKRLLFHPCSSEPFVLFKLPALKLQGNEDFNSMCFERSSCQWLSYKKLVVHLKT